MFFVFEGLMSISKLDTFRLDLVILFVLSELGPAFRLHPAFSFWTCPNKTYFQTPSCLSSLPCPNKTLFQTPSLFSSLPLSECFSLPFVNLAQLCSSVVNFFQPINQDFIKNILYQKTDDMKSIGFVFGALFFCWSRSIWLQTF